MACSARPAASSSCTFLALDLGWKNEAISCAPAKGGIALLFAIPVALALLK